MPLHLIRHDPNGSRQGPAGFRQGISHVTPPLTRNTVFAAWNLLHTARALKDTGGIPAPGNVTFNWDLSDPDHPNPEYR